MKSLRRTEAAQLRQQRSEQSGSRPKNHLGSIASIGWLFLFRSIDEPVDLQEPRSGNIRGDLQANDQRESWWIRSGHNDDQTSTGIPD